MLTQLFDLVKGEAQDAIINNPAIPNEQNNHAIGIATDSVFGGLQNALSNGGLKDVLGMFTGGGNTSGSNPIVAGITNSLVGQLIQKFGIDRPTATGISTSLIPSILGKLVHKTNDPNDSSFDINGIIGALTGSQAQQAGGVQIPGLENHAQAQAGSFDFGGILKTLTNGGLDSNHDGQMGLDDIAGIIGKVTGGNQQGQPQQGGGMMDMLKGLMGN
jgi:hypothetical protein